MSNLDDVRRIASRLPGAIVEPDGLAVSVPNKGKAKGFVWAWAERVHPKKARVRNPNVLAVAVASLSAKEILLGSDAQKFFTEPHYNGYPAILVRLEAVAAEELEDLIVEAWRTKAPADVVRQFDEA